MSKFIDIADEKGKHWCVNTSQIIYIEDLIGRTAFHIHEKPETLVIITFLKYDSVLSMLGVH